MSEREKILGRVREALQRPGATGHSKSHLKAGGTRSAYVDVLPLVGGEPEEWMKSFRRESEALRTEFHLLPDEEAVRAFLRQMAFEEKWAKLASHHAAVTDAIVPAIQVPVMWVEDGDGSDAMEACDASITGCDCLVAQTGSVVVTSRSCGGRALSVLPPHHVVLARRDQMVGGLPDAFELLHSAYGKDYPSMISFITGPSRTGDIERILVLGAHGPKRLTVLCY